MLNSGNIVSKVSIADSKSTSSKSELTSAKFFACTLVSIEKTESMTMYTVYLHSLLMPIFGSFRCQFGLIENCHRASDFVQDWWAEVTHGAKNGASFSEMMDPSISN